MRTPSIRFWSSPTSFAAAARTAQSIRDIMAATKNFSGVTGSVEFDKTNQNIKMDTIHYMETLPDLSWKALAWN